MKFFGSTIAGLAVLMMLGSASAGVSFSSSYGTYNYQIGDGGTFYYSKTSATQSNCTATSPETTECKRYTMATPVVGIFDDTDEWRLGYHRATISRPGCAGTFLNYDWDMLKMKTGHVYPSEYRSWSGEDYKWAQCVGGTGGSLLFSARKSHESNRNLYIKNNLPEARIEYEESWGFYGERQFNWVQPRIDL